MEIKDLLLPREEYAEASRAYGAKPFTFEIQKEGQSLFYFAANHSHDPENLQYPALKEYWERFLSATENLERLVLVEDSVPPELQDSEKAEIERNAERGFIAFLARKAEISVASPDMTLEELATQCEDISKEELLLYRFLGVVDAFHRHDVNEDSFEEFIERWCQSKRQMKEWEGMRLDFDSLKDSYQRVLGRPFNQEEDMNSLINPNNTGTRINEIARILSDAREIHIVSEIQKYWGEGKSLFAVFGSGHLIIQRPALEKLLQ